MTTRSPRNGLSIATRVLLVLTGAAGGAWAGVLSEFFFFAILSSIGDRVEGAGIVVVGLAPFAALIGGGIGLWGVLRATAMPAYGAETPPPKK